MDGITNVLGDDFQNYDTKITNSKDDEGDGRPTKREFRNEPGSSEVQSAESKTKHISVLKEKARALASDEQFYEASNLLEEVIDKGDSKDLGTNLLMAECYLQLGRENRANKCLKYVRNALNSEPLLPADDLIQLAKNFLAQSSYVRALLLTNIAADLHLKSDASPDEILSGVFRCHSKLDDIVKAMLKKGGRNRTIAADMGMESMLEVYEKLQGIQNCNRDQQVLKEAWCCRYMDHNYSLVEDRKKCIQFAKEAITNMEKHFTPVGAQRYRVYGTVLHNLAITLGNSQKFEESVATYQRAVEAKENATDYANDVLKKMDLEKAIRDLKEIRQLTGTV